MTFLARRLEGGVAISLFPDRLTLRTNTRTRVLVSRTGRPLSRTPNRFIVGGQQERRYRRGAGGGAHEDRDRPVTAKLPLIYRPPPPPPNLVGEKRLSPPSAGQREVPVPVKVAAATVVPVLAQGLRAAPVTPVAPVDTQAMADSAARRRRMRDEEEELLHVLMRFTTDSGRRR